MAHDTNNSLAPLVGYPALNKLQFPPDHRVVPFADAPAQAAQHVSNINQDLLALGRRAHAVGRGRRTLAIPRPDRCLPTASWVGYTRWTIGN